jgi:hypothetical protein
VILPESSDKVGIANLKRKLFKSVLILLIPAFSATADSAGGGGQKKIAQAINWLRTLSLKL